VLPSGEGDRAGGVDQAVHLDRHARLGMAAGDGWWAGGAAAVSQELVQVRHREPGRDRLETYTVDQQVHDGDVDPERDGGAGEIGAEPELWTAHGQVP
jgi:hypothetical protein